MLLFPFGFDGDICCYSFGVLLLMMLFVVVVVDPIRLMLMLLLLLIRFVGIVVGALTAIRSL